MTLRKALIIGIAGQDGYFLSELLLNKKNYQVHGVDRTNDLPFELKQNVASVTVVDLENPGQIREIVETIRPDEIYFLAAHHFSSQDEEEQTGSLLPFIRVNLVAVDEILQVLAGDLKESRFFYAASSHVFGRPAVSPQTELTPQRPETPYGISKSSALHVCRYYREKYGLYTSAGILYNHESIRRGMSFITKQIACAAALGFSGKPEKIHVRDLDAVVDWGAAEDYVRAMWLTLQQSRGDEYIVATGVPHTVREFAQRAFSLVGLDFKKFVIQENGFSALRQYPPYVGDPSKIKKMCGWEPRISFEDLVRNMVNYEIAKIQSQTI